MRAFFRPRTDPAYSLNTVAHFLMKRLFQSYNQILLMSTNDREEIFDIEMKVLEQEKKQAEEAERKAKRK